MDLIYFFPLLGLFSVVAYVVGFFLSSASPSVTRTLNLPAAPSPTLIAASSLSPKEEDSDRAKSENLGRSSEIQETKENPSLSIFPVNRSPSLTHTFSSAIPSPLPESTNRTVIVVAKSIPIRVNLTDWSVEWEDSRSFLSNLRLLSSPNLIIKWVGLAQASATHPSITSAQREEYKNVCAKQNCYPVFLSPSLHETYINGFCKEILWPMLHYVMPASSDRFGERWPELYAGYEEANSIIGAVVEEVMETPTDSIWIHNYHLFLLPSYIRLRHRYTKIGLFIHTPFPSSDIFRALPTRADLLESIMSCDLLGFHTFDYARHFLSCCKRVLDLDFETLPGGALGIKYSGRFVSILISHVGIASKVIADMALSSSVANRVSELRALYPNRKLIIGIDDLDAVKGPLLKVQAIERFCSKYKTLIDKVVFIEILLLSRNYKETEKVRDDMLTEIEKVKRRYGTSLFHVILPRDSLPMSEQVSWYRASHIALVSSFWDGLNLMPYEYTASQDETDPGVLIISEFMGCSRSLNGVLRVNPWSLEMVADTINTAVGMNLDERKANHHRRFNYVMNHTVERWALGYLDQLDRASRLATNLRFEQLKTGTHTRLLGLRSDFIHLEKSAMITSVTATEKRIIFLDYDGTLIPTDKTKGKSKATGHPPPSLLRLLSRLVEDENNCVFLMSGRTRHILSEWFGKIKELGLAAEKGLFLRWPKRLESSCRMEWRKVEEEEEENANNISHQTISERALNFDESEWEHMVNLDDITWKSLARDVIQSYTEQTDGSWIEDKEFGIIWHFEQADPEYGKMQANDLQRYLIKVLANPNVDVLKYEYSRILEVKPHGVSKGHAATAICEALLNDREKEKQILPQAQAQAQAAYFRTTSAPPSQLYSSLSKSSPSSFLPPPFATEPSKLLFLAMGDDRSDEEMFLSVQHHYYAEEKVRVGRLREAAGLRRSLTSTAEERKIEQEKRKPSAPASNASTHVYTVVVGLKPSNAHYYVNDYTEVLDVLKTVADYSRNKRGIIGRSSGDSSGSDGSGDEKEGGRGIRWRKKNNKSFEKGN